MKRRIFPILGVLFLSVFALAGTVPANHQRQISVFVVGKVEYETLKSGEPIPLTITITNGLPSSIYHETFSLVPKDWNGETANISLVDINRDGTLGGLYLERPEVKSPRNISGMSRVEIKPGGSISVKTDANKWKLRDGWFPGHYKITIRVDRLTIDDYSKLSVFADPVEFDIK